MLATAFLSSLGAPEVEVVLARYDEAVDWADEYLDRATITVYDKSKNPAPDSIRLPNVGRESHTFLHHIVDRYDSLADWTVFSQAIKPTWGYHGTGLRSGHLSDTATF